MSLGCLYLTMANKRSFFCSCKTFKITPAATGTLDMEVKIHFLCTLVHGEALSQFGLLPAEVKNIETFLDVDFILKGLACYFFL